MEVYSALNEDRGMTPLNSEIRSFPAAAQATTALLKLGNPFPLISERSPMHRGGSGRDVAEFSPAAAAATADEQGRQPSIQYPYAYSDPPAHAYADYSDYGQCSGAHYAQQGAVVEADSIPPPGDGGHQIPYGDDPQFPPYASDQQHALPPQPHELHHRGTVFASVESARWASSETDFPHQPGVADPSDPIHGALHTQAQPENNLRAHQRRRSSGLVVGDSAGAADDHPSSAFVRLLTSLGPYD